MNPAFEQRSLTYRQYIADYLKDYLEKFRQEPQRDLYSAMEYSLLAGGKRLRPVLAMEFCRIFQSQNLCQTQQEN